MNNPLRDPRVLRGELEPNRRPIPACGKLGHNIIRRCAKLRQALFREPLGPYRYSSSTYKRHLFATSLGWAAGCAQNLLSSRNERSGKSFCFVSGHDFQSCRKKRIKGQGFSPCKNRSSGAEARGMGRRVAARLKTCPDTKRLDSPWNPAHITIPRALNFPGSHAILSVK